MSTQQRFNIVPQNIPEAIELAERFAQSGLVPKLYTKSADNQYAANRIIVAWEYGASLGLGLMQTLQGVAVINGMPQVWGDTALAIVMASGLLDDIQESCTGSYEQQTLKATCTIKRKGKTERTAEFTFAQAKRANLIGKTGPWSQYPERMMQFRVRNFLLRDVFADVLKGMQIAEYANQDDYVEPHPDAIETTGTEVIPQNFAAALEQQTVETVPTVTPTPEPNPAATNQIDEFKI